MHLSDADLDGLYRAGQLVGIEIYSAATVPSEFRTPGIMSDRAHGLDARGGSECATVVLWTKAHLLTESAP